ncbi:MAG: ATP-binding protein [Planctomycetota bacterium]
MPLHPTLEAQLKRCGLSTDAIADDTAWMMLLRSIGETYRQFDANAPATPSNADDNRDEIVTAKLEAEAARATARAKSDFLANMSHEIRTPMTAILGYVDMLAEEEVSPSECRQFHDIIRRNGEHLLSLLNDILDLSKFEAGRMEIDPSTCRIMDVVQDVTLLMAQRARSSGLDFTVTVESDLPQFVRTDPTRLRQVLLNLVGNAIQFTPVGSVGVRVSADREQHRVRIAVADSGVGMSAEQLARVFTPFTQADETISRQYGGTGLGLAISARLAELLEGKLEVESELDRGSTFSLEFPVGLSEVSWEPAGRELDRPSTEPAAAKNDHLQREIGPDANRVTPGTATPARVLIAEDVDDSRQLIVRLLESAGYEVNVVEDGALARDAALEAEADGRAFDLILMDMQLPILDGYQATRELRKAGYSHPIVALTAHAMEGVRERCLEAGCDDYSSKPVRRAALLELIEKWTTRASTV